MYCFFFSFLSSFSFFFSFNFFYFDQGTLLKKCLLNISAICICQSVPFVFLISLCGNFSSSVLLVQLKAFADLFGTDCGLEQNIRKCFSSQINRLSFLNKKHLILQIKVEHAHTAEIKCIFDGSHCY